MDRADAGPSVLYRDCQSQPYSPLGGGSWKGHVWPGAVAVLGGAWWCFHASWRYHAARAAGQRRRSRGWYPGPWEWNYLFEPVLKILGGLFGLLMELRLDHDQYVSLLCPDGRFNSPNLHGWHHAASYPGFILSGLVDLLGLRVELPYATSHAFMVLAFAMEAFMMTIHTKHEALDKVLHQLLALAMWVCAATTAAEPAAPHSMVLSGARGAALILQGTWMCQIGVVMFSDPINIAWATDKATAGAHIAPALFAMHAIAAAAAALAVFVAVGGCSKWRSGGTKGASSGAVAGRADMARRAEEGNSMLLDDSANELSEGSSDGTRTPDVAPAKPRPARPVALAGALRALGRKVEAARPGAGKDAHIV